MARSFFYLLRNKTSQVFFITFISKGLSAFGALALLVVVGQLYGPEGVGLYALAQSILLGSGILARQGMANALVRFIGRDCKHSQVRNYLYWAGLRSLCVSLPLSFAVFFLRYYVERFFSMPGLSSILMGFALAIPFYTWSFLLAGFFKGVRKPATATLQENGAISLVSGALLLFISEISNIVSGDLSLLGWIYLSSAVFIAIFGHFSAWVWFRKSSMIGSFSGLNIDERLEFKASSLSFFILGIAGFLQSVISVLIAGKFLGSIELGLFKSAQQIAMSVAFVLMVINAIYPPRFAALYHEGKQSELGRSARQAALLGLLLCSPFLLICLWIPEWILKFLGDGFDPAADLLRILALAQLVNVATGSVGFLLTMTGNDRIMRNIALVCSVLGIFGFFSLTPWLGAIGATLALSFVMVAQNLVAMVAVWVNLGVWTMPGPNWLALAGIKSKVGTN